MIDFNEISLESILRLTPFSNDSQLNVNKHLTSKFFFDHFFSDPSEAGYQQAVERDVNRPKRCIVLYGYRGSGKTTFVHYLNKVFGYNMILISIDDYYYEADPIRYQLATYLHNVVLLDINNKLEIFNKFLEVFNSENNRYFFLTRIDKVDRFEDFIKLISSYSTKKLADEDITEIKEQLMGKRISFLMMMITLYNLCERLLHRNTGKVFFCLDNMDAIEDIVFIQDFMGQYVVFRNNVSFILDNISHPEITEKNNNRFQDYFFIITARESTKAKMNAHFNIDYINSIEYINLSVVFSKVGILNKRIDYLLAEKIINKTQIKRIENCKMLFNDSLFSSVFVSMFNNDYRKMIHVASLLAFHESEFDKYRALMGIGTDSSKYGARGIVFHLIFSYLLREDEIKDVMKHQIEVMNILNYLKNYDNRYSDIIFDDPTTSLDLLSLSKDFDEILSINDLIYLLFMMYNMKDSHNWAHLVTFDRLRVNNQHEVKKQINLIKAKEDDSSKYAKVRITCAGLIFLKYIISHFEFLSLQCGNNEFLFSDNNLKKRKQAYEFETIIEKVYNRLREFNGKIIGISKDGYLGSMFSYYEQVRDEARVANIHTYERIIFTHISYLDNFRLYLLNNMSLPAEEKREINEKLTGCISKYIDIFNEFEASPHAKSVSENMVRCIIEIIDSSYNNWKINIDDKTGELLLKGESEDENV